MKKTASLLAGASLLVLANVSLADDHLFTAVGAGGLTTSSQPFLNGINNPGRPGESVPGEGSPLSGEEDTVPAVDVESLLTHHFTQQNTHANPGNGTSRVPQPVDAGLIVPRGR